MTLYEAIYARKSVRSYLMEPLDERILIGIFEFLDQMEPLFPQIKIKVEIIENRNQKQAVKGMFLARAPYYLVLYSEKKEKYEMNAGFIMEQIALFLCSRGIGTCMMGMVKRPKNKDAMEYVISMAFGKPRKVLKRGDNDSRRIPMDDLCAYKERPKNWVKDILEAARLAPSSMNSQPWRFVVYENRIHVFAKNQHKGIPGIKNFQEFNIGCMLANVSAAAEEAWVDLDFIKLNNITHKAVVNCSYVLSIILKL